MRYLAIAVFVLVIHTAWWMTTGTIMALGDLNDGDSYTRLVRVTELFETGNWFDNSFPRANAPYGDTLHWTRLFDIFLLALAFPLTPLLGFSKALYFAGVFINPLLHVLTAITLAWAAMPLLGRAGAAFAGGLTAVQFGVLGYATVGHADHHMLYALSSVLAFGFLLRQNGAFAAGIALAFGFWVGIEEIVFLAICLSVTAIPWLIREKGAAEKNYQLCLGLTLTLALILLVERGPTHYLDVEYDRVSIVTMTMAALLAAFWGIVKGKSLNHRLAVGVAGITLITITLSLLFPKILLGPMADVDPKILPLINDIMEFAPLSSVWYFLIYVGSAVFALPWALWRIKEEWKSPNLWPWVLAAASVAVYLAFTISWVRWAMYAGIFLSIPLADLLVRIDTLSTERLKGAARILVKTIAILVVSAGPLITGAAGAKKTAPVQAKKECVLKDMATFLNQPPFSDRPQTIVASVNFGPELLYRTPHSVLATLYHRNSPGILDSIDILGGKDSLKLIRERKVDLLLLCPNSSHDYYLEGGDLYQRLMKGDLPPWLKEVPFPPEPFRLFAVK